MFAVTLPVRAWQDEELGIAFQSPPGWKPLHSNGTGGKVKLVPGDGGGNNLQTKVRFLAPFVAPLGTNIGFEVTDLGEVSQLDKRQILQVTRSLAVRLKSNSYRMLGLKSTKIAGVPAYKLSYRAVVKGQPVIVAQAFLVKGGMLLLFTLTTTPGNFAQAKTTFDQLLRSVHWMPYRL